MPIAARAALPLGLGLVALAEVEGIGPGTSRQPVVPATAGSYLAACKPGMSGDGIRRPFTVTGSDAATPQSPLP